MCFSCDLEIMIVQSFSVMTVVVLIVYKLYSLGSVGDKHGIYVKECT